MENIFEKASRLRVRFDTPKGLLTTEDLWSLPLTSETGKANLNDIAVGLHHAVKGADEISFVTPATGANEADKVAFEVVKRVIEVRIVERDAAKVEAEKAEKKRVLLAALNEAENKELTTGSVEELRAKLAAL